MEQRLKRGQKLDLRMRRMDLGLRGECCRFNLQKRYEESEQLLGTVHRIKAGGCRERWRGTTSTVHLLVQEPSERERQDGWRLERGHLETGLGGPGGNKADSLTHGRTHIQCSWSRSCRPSAHGQRRRFLWNYRPPCGSLRRPACQTPAPER